MCIGRHSLLFFSLSIFKPVVVFPPRLCVSAFSYFFSDAVRFLRSPPIPDAPPLYIHSSHPPGCLYKKRTRRAFKQSRYM
uniref:Uncharacterized protein n=1 Tax=Human betaherpesvirus 6A TaxID=32603 RepID=A0A2L2QDU3_9BETA|nr:hypothetical protein [Human betaherpesvirus 6A]AVI09310.1 hypothetical protein [Human betaherpesvirus 6A]